MGKKWKKEKNSPPTDRNIFKPVSGDTTFFLFGLVIKKYGLYNKFSRSFLECCEIRENFLHANVFFPFSHFLPDFSSIVLMHGGLLLHLGSLSQNLQNITGRKLPQAQNSQKRCYEKWFHTISVYLQDDTFTESYISTIGVDFVSIFSAWWPGRGRVSV